MQTETEILILIFLGIAAMIIMALTIVVYIIQYHKKGISNKLEIERIKTKQQEELINTISNAQESERRRISSNLHDEVGSSLSAVSYMLGDVIMITDGDAKNLSTKAENHLQNTMTEIRNIIQDMSPVIVEKFGLIAAVEGICYGINELKRVELVFNSKIDESFENKTIELKLYRIVQELVNNTLKHANATLINIDISKSEDMLNILVVDNGVGIDIDSAANSKSLGLDNIKAQLKFMEGEFKLKRLEKGGTSASVSVPLKKILFLQ